MSWVGARRSGGCTPHHPAWITGYFFFLSFGLWAGFAAFFAGAGFSALWCFWAALSGLNAGGGTGAAAFPFFFPAGGAEAPACAAGGWAAAAAAAALAARPRFGGGGGGGGGGGASGFRNF